MVRARTRQVKSRISVLLIQNDPVDVQFVRQICDENRGRPFHLESVPRLDTALEQLGGNEYEAVLVDTDMPDLDPPEVLGRIRDRAPGVAIVVLTSVDEESFALQTVQWGAHEYLFKGFLDSYTLSRSIRYAIERRRTLEELERVMARLRTSEESFRNVITLHPDAVLIVDGEGIIRFLNPASERLFGRPSRQLIGEPFGYSLTPDETTEVDVVRGEDRRIAEMRCFDAEWEGEKVRVAALRDVTERRRMEERLRWAHKMEAVATLAGGVANDFNNLLTGISGYAQLIKAGGQPWEHVCAAAESIQECVRRAFDLTSKLLGFARRGKLLDIPLDLHQVLRGLAEELRKRAPESVQVRTRLTADPATIVGDPDQIYQVLLNLANNAIEATEGRDRCELTFETRVVDLDEDYCRIHAGAVPGRYLEIRVTDTGRGMDEATRQRIFEPFFTTKARRGEGTGLGMAMVYGIVKNHGGSIRVYSEPDRGTAVKLYLPLYTGRVPAHPARERRTPVHGTGHILVVDDEAVVRDVASKLLTRLGYRVTTVPGGAEAVSYYREHPGEVDLVIVDMVMPGMDGRECFRALKQIDPDVRALLSSGYGLNHMAQEILDEGMLGFIQKPYHLVGLSEGVARAIQRG